MRSVWLVLGFTSLVACAGKTEGDPSAPSSEGPKTGSPASSDSSSSSSSAASQPGSSTSTKLDEGTPIWKATSVAIELQSWGFFDGARGYRKTREAMTSSELDELDKLRAKAATPNAPGNYSEGGVSVRVIDADGSVATYGGSDGLVVNRIPNFPQGDACVVSKMQWKLRTRRTSSAPTDPKTVSMSDTLDVPNDASCLNGLMEWGCDESIFSFKVDQAGKHAFSARNCVDTHAVRFLSSAGDILAETASSASGECPTLTADLAPGTYGLQIARACPSTSDIGELMFTVGPSK